MNAKVYQIKSRYYAIEGDVWGKVSKEYRGFELGEIVQWSTTFGKKRGRITGFANKEEFMVQEDGQEMSELIKVKKLFKVADPLVDR